MSIVDFWLFQNLMNNNSTGNTVTLEDAGLFGEIVKWVLIGGLTITALFFLFCAVVIVWGLVDNLWDKFKKRK